MSCEEHNPKCTKCKHSHACHPWDYMNNEYSCGHCDCRFGVVYYV